MTNQSQLLIKAKKDFSKNRFRIPRRGRIRIVLILSLITISLCIYNSRKQEPDLHNENRPQKQKEQADTQAVTLKQPIIKEHPSKLKQLKKLSLEDVKGILKENHADFSRQQDTFSYKGSKIVSYYSIDTTIDQLGKTLLSRYHPKYGSIVAIEPSTGRVLCLVSYTNPEEKSLGNNLYCKSLFPAASIFKTVTAAGAIERGGLTAESILKTTGSNHTLYRYQLKKDLDNFREISFTEAYAYSVNPVFGRLGIYILGHDGLNEYAAKFGFNTVVPFEIENEISRTQISDSAYLLAELASGFNQETTISPLFGALIASAVANRGMIPIPTVVDSITNLYDGEVLYRASPRYWRIPVKPQTALELEKLMQKVAQFGTARKSFRYIKESYRFNEISYGGKTGSVDQDSTGRVDWFIGFVRHKDDTQQRVTAGVVTVHGSNWTVHSSYLGAEIMRKHIRKIQISKEKSEESVDISANYKN